MGLVQYYIGAHLFKGNNLLYVHNLISAALPEFQHEARSILPRVSAVTLDLSTKQLIKLMTIFCALCNITVQLVKSNP